MKLDHINISAPREILDEEKSFLCSIFDLVEGFRPDFSSFGYWLYSGENALVHMSESERHFASDKPHILDHVAFEMKGLSAFLANLSKLGVSYKKRYQQQTMITQIFLVSPSGLTFEVSFKNEFLE